MSNRTLFVTDAGSLSVGGTLYMPGQEVPIGVFDGREQSLRELVATGKVSQRRRRMRSDEHGRVIKIDRSSGAPPLPAEISEYDAKKRREVRPLRSEIVGGSEVAGALAALKRQQQEDEITKANDARTVAAEAVRQEAEEVAAPEPDLDALARVAAAAAPEDDDVYEESGDELFAEDSDLLDELAAG